MSDPEEEPYSIIFASLKHPVRRKILRMLSEKSMSFSEMLDALKVSSPFLTYHLENLGELVCKTTNGKYRLSTFGDTAIITMSRVEEIPRLPSSRSNHGSKSRHNMILTILHGMATISLVVVAIGLVFASLYFVNYTSSSNPYNPLTFYNRISLHPDENFTYYIAIDNRSLTSYLFPNESNVAPVDGWRLDDNNTFWIAGPPTGNSLTHWAVEGVHFDLTPSADIKFSRELVWNENGGTVNNPEYDYGTFVAGNPILSDLDITEVTQPVLYEFAITNLDSLKDMNDTLQIHVVWQYFDKPYFYYGQTGLAVAAISLTIALLYPILKVSDFLWGSVKRSKESKMQPENQFPARNAFKGEVLDKQLVAKLSKKYTHPEQALRYWLEHKMSQGKTREQALKEIDEENA